MTATELAEVERLQKERGESFVDFALNKMLGKKRRAELARAVDRG